VSCLVDYNVGVIMGCCAREEVDDVSVLCDGLSGRLA
jgi:hypothetical protein